MTGRTWKLAAAVAGAWLLLLALFDFPVAPEISQAPGATCHAYSDKVLPMAAAQRLEWHCGSDEWQDGQAVTWLSFTRWDRERPPTLFTTRSTVFASIAVAALDGDAGGDGGPAMRMREYRMDEARALLAGPIFGVRLPEAGPATQAYLVRIVRPHSVTVASEAQLRHEPLSGVMPASLVLVAMVAGMLVMPLMFDIMFFLVLRERFVLLHAGMIVSMIVYVLAAGGIASAFADLPVRLLAIAGPLAWALGSGIAGFFITAFLERDMLPRALRRTVHLAAAIAAIGGGLCALQLEFTQPFDNQLYFGFLIPLVPVYTVAIGWALWRKSRAARYLAIAFLPIFAAAAERLLRGLGAHASSSSIDNALFLALSLEVVVITLGVADRFLSIRHERDQAIVKAQTMKRLSERDALTGLRNRRVIEERFVALRQEGFTTMAVLDLDHFKQVNDTFGHAVGDDVLKVVGRVLQAEDADMLAFRMGGEEFLLMGRGGDAVERAEARRQEIARMVAREDLGCLVTASMGIVEITGGALPGASFSSIYARADRLLYEAKSSGRNRMACERLRAFRTRRGERRAAA